jgi:hypothetical protein
MHLIDKGSASGLVHASTVVFFLIEGRFAFRLLLEHLLLRFQHLVMDEVELYCFVEFEADRADGARFSVVAWVGLFQCFKLGFHVFYLQRFLQFVVGAVQGQVVQLQLQAEGLQGDDVL